MKNMVKKTNCKKTLEIDRIVPRKWIGGLQNFDTVINSKPYNH